MLQDESVMENITFIVWSDNVIIIHVIYSDRPCNNITAVE